MKRRDRVENFLIIGRGVLKEFKVIQSRYRMSFPLLHLINLNLPEWIFVVWWIKFLSQPVNWLLVLLWPSISWALLKFEGRSIVGGVI